MPGRSTATRRTPAAAASASSGWRARRESGVPCTYRTGVPSGSPTSSNPRRRPSGRVIVWAMGHGTAHGIGAGTTARAGQDGGVQPIVTPEEMAAIDAAAPEPVEVLIERAGAAVARAALDLLGGAYGRRVVVLAGQGQQRRRRPGRGRAGCEARGVRCRVLDAADAPAVLPRRGPGDRRGVRHRVPGHVRRRPPWPDPATPVLAVDIPSGVDGLTGVASGRPLPRRPHGHLRRAQARPAARRRARRWPATVEVADIGLDASSARAHRVEPADVAGWLPDRPRETHKWKAAVWLVAGSPGHDRRRPPRRPARPSGRAPGTCGSRSRARATTSTPRSRRSSCRCRRRGWADEVLDGLERFGALAVGPGLGTDPDAARRCAAPWSAATGAHRGRRRRPPGPRRPTPAR